MAGMTEISDKAPRLSAAAIASAIDQSGIKEMALKLANEVSFFASEGTLLQIVSFQFGGIRTEYRLGSEPAPEVTLETLESRKEELESLVSQVNLAE